MSYRSSWAREATMVALGLVLVGVVSSPLAGQDPAAPTTARLQGVVMEESTFEPVDSAVVSIVGTSITTTTGKWGTFSLPDAPVGPISIRVSAPKHPSVVQDVNVGDSGVLFVQVSLPSVAAMLDGLLVNSRSRKEQVGEVAQTAADLLADKVPRARMSQSILGKTDYRISLRAPNSFIGNQDPIILIDGVVLTRSEDAYDALARIPASDVETIEVLKGTDAFKYPYSANGVVNVVTKRGRR